MARAQAAGQAPGRAVPDVLQSQLPCRTGSGIAWVDRISCRRTSTSFFHHHRHPHTSFGSPPLNHPSSTPHPSQPLATSISHRFRTPRLANNLEPTLPPWTLYSSRHSKMPGLVSATGVLAFLSEEEPELKVFALQTLNDDIDTVWTEVAGALSQMYVLS